MRNPFTPGFGTYPTVPVQRQEILRRLANAYHPASHADPASTLVLIGDRGLGKTVLLDMAHDLAVNSGWLVVEVSGFGEVPLSDRIIAGLEPPSAGPTPTTATRFGLSLGPASIERFVNASPTPPAGNLEAALTRAIDRQPPPTGVLISVDELHDVPELQLKETANDIQLLRRKGHRIAFAAAGLPDLALGDPARMPTFIARAWQPTLTLAASDEIRRAFHATLGTENLHMTSQALKAAVIAAGGLPYAMQLVGWHVVDHASPRTTIDLEDVTSVLGEVHQTLVRSLFLDYELSAGSKAFLAALCIDGDTASYATICSRLRRTQQQLSPVRARLIASGHLTVPERGHLQIAHLALRAAIASDPTIPRAALEAIPRPGLTAPAAWNRQPRER